jgi:hypothetical protein
MSQDCRDAFMSNTFLKPLLCSESRTILTTSFRYGVMKSMTSFSATLIGLLHLILTKVCVFTTPGLVSVAWGFCPYLLSHNSIKHLGIKPQTPKLMDEIKKP